MSYEIGDWVDDFKLPSSAGAAVALSDTVGLPVVLIFVPGGDAAGAAAVARAFAELHPAFKELSAAVRLIRRGGAAAGDDDALDGAPDSSLPADLPFPVLADTDGQLAARYGADGFRTVLVSPAARVAKVYDAAASPAHAADVLNDVRALLTVEPPRQVIQQAPVLLIPEVLPPAFCRHLIDVWETQNVDSGFMVEEGGKTVGRYDYGHKIRRDHFVQPGSELYRQITAFAVRRVIPQMTVAFNYEASRMEPPKIACYDAARGGYFRPHRDNTTAGTAHRRFAISLLLNDDYEGGFLRFPEFGPHLYRPSAGGAVVFSSTLLHEATDVTAGRRFVLLTFFYGEKEARAREEYERRTGGVYRAGASA